MIPQANPVIYDFSKSEDFDSWHVVNDDVMGGLSQTKLSVNDIGNGLFEGWITIENNGGFSSVKYLFSRREVSHYEVVKLRIKGDGKPYQFRIKSNEAQQYSYIQEFQTLGEWEIICIPFDTFSPSFRGKTLQMPNYNGKFIEEVAFLIGNKKNEAFVLEIERIWME